MNTELLKNELEKLEIKLQHAISNSDYFAYQKIKPQIDFLKKVLGGEQL